jgi:heme-degrading monooxygenase HmoA
MILEMARVTVEEGSQAAFEAAVAEARPLFDAAEGCHGMELHRIIEAATVYLVLVRWETMEHHTVGFRGSPAFTRWRELAGPFFAAAPEVWHTEAVSPS